jgi:uncharacterized protein YdeI (YjbR/CyaY-like superfamily)
MAIKLVTIEVSSRDEWRNWLRDNHRSHSGLWLVFHKGGAPEASFTYEDAVQEALCFGWIDSLVKRLDDRRYARKFTPRKPDSKWSTMNRRRYADLQASGFLTSAGLDRAPTARSGDAPRPELATIPGYIQKELRADPRASKYFEQLAPSCRRAYIGWIDSAKRDETKQKRLREAIGMLASGKKLGLK